MPIALLDFFTEEADAPRGAIAAMAASAGIANGLLLAIINNATEVAANDEDVQVRLFLLYLLLLLLFIYGKRFALSRAVLGVESAVRRVRLRIADKIRHSELLLVERVGESEIYTRLTYDTGLISQSAIMLTSACQSAVVLFFALLYLAFLSPLSLLITALMIYAGVYLYLSHYNRSAAQLREARQQEAEFLDSLSSILKGFKELKLNQTKSDDLFHHTDAISHRTETLKANVGVGYVTDEMFSQIFYYLLLAVLVFLMPMLLATHAGVIVKVVAVVLFIVGPLEMLVGSIPMFTRATVAVENLRQLEAQLDAAERQQRASPAALADNPFRTFTRIRLDGLVFHYRDREGRSAFSVGPTDLEIQRGELVFIVGGNGSGKSTLMKLLTGLYFPADGYIRVDGQPVTGADYALYRELFSTIFTDFHLFDRLYGLEAADPARVNQLLKLMQIDHKTRFQDGRFTETRLSTGQRKRLALVACLLEDRPLYVFDEWAADQDPQFRRFFYQTLLRDLQAQGKTIIAVTHDDHYFHVADRILKMDYGRLNPA